MEKESHMYSIIKSISWRVWATLCTMLISFTVTHSWQFALSIGSLEAVSKLLLFYLHERIWANIKLKRFKTIPG